MALPILTPKSQMSKVILPVTGNAANVTSANLPYGMYLDNDDFVSGAVDQVAFTYKMLGGDVSVQLDIGQLARRLGRPDIASMHPPRPRR